MWNNKIHFLYIFFKFDILLGLIKVEFGDEQSHDNDVNAKSIKIGPICFSLLTKW